MLYDSNMNIGTGRTGTLTDRVGHNALVVCLVIWTGPAASLHSLTLWMIRSVHVSVEVSNSEGGNHSSSETLLTCYQTTKCQIPEDSDLQMYCHLNCLFENPLALKWIISFILIFCWPRISVGGRPVCRSERNCIPDGHLHWVIYTRWCIDTIDSPDDEHWVVRNM